MLDTLIRKRFNELETKAEEVSKTRVFKFKSNDGVVYYKIPFPQFTGWGVNVLNLLERVMGEGSVHYDNFNKTFQEFSGWESEFETCKSILLSAKEDYDNGYLFNVRALVKAEVLDDALEQAQVLLDAGYKDPACVLVGVSLEIALKEICTREGIPPGKADKINVELRKLGIYNMAKQKQITAWADLRNKAAHGDWSAYDQADVQDFLNGANRFIADYL